MGHRYQAGLHTFVDFFSRDSSARRETYESDPHCSGLRLGNIGHCKVDIHYHQDPLHKRKPHLLGDMMTLCLERACILYIEITYLKAGFPRAIFLLLLYVCLLLFF